jgi:V/A-type H+-transporting ATPase subunit D
MAKVKLTKNELKKQKDNLKRFNRYLPTLELKKKQLLQEINRIQHIISSIQDENDRVEKVVLAWVDLFAEEFDLKSLIRIKELITSTGSIAGIDIPIFGDLIFKDVEYDFFETPLWVDHALEICKEQIRRRMKREIAKEQKDILREELRITIQRIKLFEEVKIPEAKENIRIIRIFLGDLQTAEVVRGKIAKLKIEKKRLLAVQL